MKKLIALAGLTLLTGCFGPAPKMSVFGKSGKAYTAPDLCSALVQCLNSNEASCFYDHATYHFADGATQEDGGCKEVKK